MSVRTRLLLQGPSYYQEGFRSLGNYHFHSDQNFLKTPQICSISDFDFFFWLTLVYLFQDLGRKAEFIDSYMKNPTAASQHRSEGN